MNVITLNNLKDALMYAFSLTPEEAYRQANIILDLFGFDDYIIDNILAPGERKLILGLQEKGMISSFREDTTINNGVPWRIYYWRLEARTIIEYAKNKKNNKKESDSDVSDQEDNSIYATIPDNQWRCK